MEGSKVSMKLLIDTQSKRVLFAEASKETIDFLFHIITLPVATIIRLLRKEGMVGSLANLYDSIENLDESYIQPNKAKETLLKPIPPVGISSVPLLLKEDSKTCRNFYRCSQTQYCICRVSDYPNAICPQCNKIMTMVVPYVAPPGEQVSSTEGGFVKGVVTYMVMDNLLVKPMSAISTITLLNKFNVKEVGTLQEKEVTLGMDEGSNSKRAAITVDEDNCSCEEVVDLIHKVLELDTDA